MRILKWILGVLVLAALGWGAGWFALATGQEKALSTWFDTRRAQGWQAEFASVEVSGFPRSFRRRLDEPRLADPDTGWAWQAPWVEAESPVVAPNTIKVVLPPEQTIAVPGEKAKVRAKRFVVDLGVAPDTALEVRTAGFDLLDLDVSSEAGWAAGAARAGGRIARREPGSAPDFTYGLDLDAEDVILPKKLIRRLDPAGLLPAKVEHLELRGAATLLRQLDRVSLETGNLAARTLVIRKSELRWDKIRLRAQGRLDADEQGFPEGEIALALREWRRLIELAQRAGLIGRDAAQAVRRAIEFQNALFSSNEIKLTLSFRAGQVLIGPFPVARAPRMIPPG